MSFLQRILESAHIRNFITGVILFNALILGLETSQIVMAKAGSIVEFLDRACLTVFVVELVVKLIAYRLRVFRDGWNIFDFIIVGVSLVPAARGCLFCAFRGSCVWCRWRRACGGFYHGPAEYGLDVFGDGNYFLYWVCDGH